MSAIGIPMRELDKACPFCGKNLMLNTVLRLNRTEKRYYATCPNDECVFGSTRVCKEEEELVGKLKAGEGNVVKKAL